MKRLLSLAFLIFCILCYLFGYKFYEMTKKPPETVAPGPKVQAEPKTEPSPSKGDVSPGETAEEKRPLGGRYFVHIDNTQFSFNSIVTALSFARQNGGAKISGPTGETLWGGNHDGKSVFIDGVQLVRQMPELPRGCEVTSLAMLLNFNGLEVDKMELAEKIVKDDTPFKVVGGVRYGGNPNTGFVGDMYNFSKHGFGVYNGPIYQLLLEYEPDRAVNFTGCEFEDLYYILEAGQPVWVIINSTYAPLGPESFETWSTAQGDIEITYSEHSVLIVGFDQEYIYFNDPLGLNNKAPKDNFIKAWEQMGKQAVAMAPLE